MTAHDRTLPARRVLTRQGGLGIALLAAAWAVSWSRTRPWSDFGFFPLWLGYIVSVDALVRRRLGRSLLEAGAARVLLVFGISAAMWWLFEAINLRTDNWHYLRAAPISVPRFVLESSIDFSTVLPAVFETTALLHTWLPGRRGSPGGQPSLPGVWAGASLVAGVAAIALMLLQPHYFFPFVWVGLFLVLDPINAALGAPSLLAAAYRAHWRPLLVLALAGVACGLLWEMWNSLSMPKWYYTVPLVPQQRLFEMPLVGYSGYVPFAWECFAIYTLASRTFWARPGVDHAVPLYVPLA